MVRHDGWSDPLRNTKSSASHPLTTPPTPLFAVAVLQYKIPAYDSAVMVDIPGMAALFEQVAQPGAGDLAAKWCACFVFVLFVRDGG